MRNSKPKQSSSVLVDGVPKKYALVRWLSGTYRNQMTHNVDISWIRDLNDGDDFRDESYVVEWRIPPMPRSGWPLFDGKILEISGEY